MSSKSKRYFIFDLIRGLAVFLMVLAHSVYFFYSGTNSFILNLETIGNTVCFSLFLFISGSTLYVAYLKDEETETSMKKRLTKRILMLLTSYYLLAFIVSLRDLASSTLSQKILISLDILSFRNLPSYTEYIAPFIAFSLLLLLAPKFFIKTSKSIKLTLFWAILIYILGSLIYLIPQSTFLLPWKALLFGHDGFYRFPLFQYFSLFLIGLNFGHRIINFDGLVDKLNYTKKSILINILLYGVLFLIYAQSGNQDSYTFLHRWPPSPAFLILSLLTVFTLTYLFSLTKQLRRWPILRDFLLLFGQNAYAIFWTHILVLSFYRLAGGETFSSVTIFLALFGFLTVLTLALATFLPFNFKFNLTMLRHSHEEEESLLSEPIVQLGEDLLVETKKDISWFRRYFFIGKREKPWQRRKAKKRHLLLFGLAICLAVLLLSPTVLSEIKTTLSAQRGSAWWDDSFAYRQPFTISNKNAFSDLSKNSILSITFDHQNLIKKSISNEDGSDIRLVYFNGKKSTEISYSLSNDWNRNDTTLNFSLPETIKGSKSSENYYLYFDNGIASEVKSDKLIPSKNVDYEIAIKEIEGFSVLTSINKRWNLIEDKVERDPIKITTKSSIALKNPTASWKIASEDIEGKMEYVENDIFEGEINTDRLKPGRYQVIVTIVDSGRTYQSNLCGFIMTKPLYVAWTIDWEGYDTSQNSLDALTKYSNLYDLPMTHFWNPRIYATSTISSERSQYLTNWLKNRLEKGDGLGLHLHMFYDLVASAGVTVRETPSWGGNKDGYDIPVTAYTGDELKAIIERSFTLFSENGLVKPDLFRAGAWFADTTTLDTLANLGFVADSSGRTKYQFGSKQMKGPWDLEETTQPYKASRENQNLGSLSDPINILEIPDNGADSYWFSDQEMIDRLNKNLGEKVLKENKQLTFLTHPHWFKDSEQTKINNLLTEISKYRADKDLGPVKFITQEEIAKIWGMK